MQDIKRTTQNTYPAEVLKRVERLEEQAAQQFDCYTQLERTDPIRAEYHYAHYNQLLHDAAMLRCRNRG